MDERVANALRRPVPTPFHKQILEDCRALVEMSRRKMSTYYARWDAADQVYRGLAQADSEDAKAAARGEPTKFVVPLTYSQVQTFVSFAMNVFLQRDRFFELVPVNPEAARAARVAEALLQRDLIHSNWENVLYQFLLDIARFGVGILKTLWVHEQEPTETNVGGAWTVPTVATRFLGNRILNISPYQFFPDPRLSLRRFQEGEFVASEQVLPVTELRRMEQDGLVAGIDHVPPFQFGLERNRRLPIDTDLMGRAGQTQGMALVTEVQVKLIPNRYFIDNEPLGSESAPVTYVVWYVNDQRVVKCEPLVTGHGQFTYDVAEYNPDDNHFLSDSLCDTIDMLQRTVSWFINSRITSVRKVISNRLVVDPQGVEMRDLQERSPIIRLKPAAMGRGVDTFIKQLEVMDVTANHLADARYLMDLVRLTTGISENLQGQFYRGRRTAEEARAVVSAAAGRLKSLLTIIFNRALEPLGRKLLANLRKGLTEDVLVRVVGLVEGVQFFKVNRADLQGDYDFEVFDGTLPSEKGYTAMALQELLLGLMAKPEVAVAFGIDPKAILLEILQLRGVRCPERFFLKNGQQHTAGTGSAGTLPSTSLLPAPASTPGGTVPGGIVPAAEPRMDLEQFARLVPALGLAPGVAGAGPVPGGGTRTAPA